MEILETPVKHTRERSKCVDCKARGVVEDGRRWSPDGVVCYPCWKVRGRPIKPGSEAAPKEVSDVPPQLQAIRLAMKWRSEDLPEHPMVRFYVELRRSNPSQVALQWERMEREYKGGKPLADVSGSSEPIGVESGQPDDVTGETLLPLCDRLLVECVERGREEAGKLRSKS